MKQHDFSIAKLSVLDGAMNFIRYLESYWLGDLLLSWSTSSRKAVADDLKISINQLPTTNNLLESFNSHLKSSHLSRFQRNGCSLRVDVLAVLLVKYIAPNIILRRKLQRSLLKYKMLFLSVWSFICLMNVVM